MKHTIFAIAAVLLITGAASAEDANQPYQLDETWPTYAEDAAFEMGSGIAVDKDGIIYAYTRDIEHWAAHPLAMESKMGKSSISMFNRAGDYLGKWAPSDERGFGLGAHTLYIESDGMFWAVDRDGHTVKKYDPDGTLLLTLGKFAEPGDGPEHLNGPTAVVVQKNGNIVVADGYWNSRLIWFTPEGEFIKEVGGWGRSPAQFNTVHSLAQDAEGRLFAVDLCGGNYHSYMTVPGQVADHRSTVEEGCKGRIQIFDADGTYQTEWTHITPLSVAIYGDKVYAADKAKHLAILDLATGKELERIENAAVFIHQMTMAPDGDIYIASVYPERGGFKRGPEGPSHRRWTRDAE